jgi:hypothetical protein
MKLELQDESITPEKMRLQFLLALLDSRKDPKITQLTPIYRNPTGHAYVRICPDQARGNGEAVLKGWAFFQS